VTPLHSLRSITLPTALAAVLLSSACAVNSTGEPDEAGGRTLSVTASGAECALSATSAPAGTLSFEVDNAGSEVTEFYLLGDDGQRIIGEVENIGPGLTRNLVVTVPEGDYYTVCKPGMTGEGIRAAFEVTPSGDDTTTTGLDAGLFFLAFVRDPRSGFIDVQNRMARHDALMEYLTFTSSALFAVPPGPGGGEFVGQALFA
jgi:hypothetical protein